jgi:HAD superfamily hydrolase (TIGR01490 family)
MKQPLKKLAVFDIDGTIFRSSLLIELVDALIEEGMFKPGTAKIYARNKTRWLDRVGDYGTYIDDVVVAFKKSMKGVRYKDFLRVTNQVVALHRNRVYRFTRDLVCDLKKKGYYLVAISHSPKSIVEPFAKQLGFHKTYGVIYEIDAETGTFNGKMLYGDIIGDKAKIVARIMEGGRVTLRGSVGVGDTESDVPFLHIVQHPICFNPNKKLLAAAQKNKWEVVVERKDVIYKINKKQPL